MCDADKSGSLEVYKGICVDDRFGSLEVYILCVLLIGLEVYILHVMMISLEVWKFTELYVA